MYVPVINNSYICIMHKHILYYYVIYTSLTYSDIYRAN